MFPSKQGKILYREIKYTVIHTQKSEDNLGGIKSLAKTSQDNSSETRTDGLSETSSFFKNEL